MHRQTTAMREAITHKTTLACLSAAGRCLKSAFPPLQGEETSGGKSDKAGEKGGKTRETDGGVGWGLEGES